MIQIHPARFPEQVEAVRGIFREYAESLGINLSFQQFDAELADLPGKFAAPRGRVLLAYHTGRVDWLRGFATHRRNGLRNETALRSADSGRGLQAGKQLATLICATARELGI